MDYGTDFILDGNDDVAFTADGDIKLVDGPAMVAQDIAQTLEYTKGSIYWDADCGSTMPLFLNDANADPAAVMAELKRVAIDDPRVDPDSVKVTQISDTKFRLEFTPLSAIEPQTLDYDLTKNAAQEEE
jgi:hypothetical protein